VDLPYSTKVLIMIGGAHREIQTGACLLVLLIAILGHLILHRGWFKRSVDAFKLCLPVYRNIHGQELLGWYCSLVSVLMRGGIPVPRALQLAAHASPNGIFASFADEVVEKVASGIPLTEAVSACPVIPLDARYILASGEEGNILAESFQSVGQLYRTRLLRELRSIVNIVEPVAIILLGILVAWFVQGAYRPIFMMSTVVAGH
jgi:type II secretory pathway component PulF